MESRESGSVRQLPVAMIALLLLLAGSNAVAEVSFAGDVGLRWEDNIGLASKSSDKVDDFTIHVGAGLDWLFVQTATAEVGVHAGGYYDAVDDVSDISRYGVEGSARYRGQASADLTAFWWGLDGEIMTLKHKDSKIRDGYIWELGATVGKRLNRTFALNGGYRYERRKSTKDVGQPAIWRANEVFDLKKDVFFVHGDIALGPVTTLMLEFNYKEGDEATSFTTDIVLVDTIEWGWDPAFGPGSAVWKVDAKQYIYDVSIIHSFTEKFSIDAGYTYVDADGDAGVWGKAPYKNNVIQATVTYQF